jgi:hypothetical protein
LNHSLDLLFGQSSLVVGNNNLLGLSSSLLGSIYL